MRRYEECDEHGRRSNHGSRIVSQLASGRSQCLWPAINFCSRCHEVREQVAVQAISGCADGRSRRPNGGATASRERHGRPIADHIVSPDLGVRQPVLATARLLPRARSECRSSVRQDRHLCSLLNRKTHCSQGPHFLVCVISGSLLCELPGEMRPLIVRRIFEATGSLDLMRSCS
jgi:hypothetical protein